MWYLVCINWLKLVISQQLVLFGRVDSFGTAHCVLLTTARSGLNLRRLHRALTGHQSSCIVTEYFRQRVILVARLGFFERYSLISPLLFVVRFCMCVRKNRSIYNLT